MLHSRTFLRWRPRLAITACCSAVFLLLVWLAAHERNSHRPTTLPTPSSASENGRAHSIPTASKVAGAQSDRAEYTPRASRSHSAASVSAVDHSRLQRIFSGEVQVGISEADAANFLARHGRTAGNLLAVFSILPQPDLLAEAAERFPDDPRVQLTMITNAPDAEARAGWIARFRESHPENPLGPLYAAEHALQAGNPAAAAGLLAEAIERPGLYTWISESILDRQALLAASGYSPLEARILARYAEKMPYIQTAMRVGRELLEWNRQSPEPDPAVFANTYALGNLFLTPEGSRTLIGQLVGIALERRALALLPPESNPLWLDTTAADRSVRLEKEAAGIKSLAGSVADTFAKADPAAINAYLDHFDHHGEEAAIKWFSNQAGAPVTRP